MKQSEPAKNGLFSQCGAPFMIAKLVNIPPTTMVYDTSKYSIHGVLKPSNITGAPHLANVIPLRLEKRAGYGPEGR